MKTTDKIEILRKQREDLESQLSEIAEIERLMGKFGFCTDEVRAFGESLTRKWADVCIEHHDLLEERLDYILASLEALTMFDDWSDEQMSQYHELEDERVRIIDELYFNE